MIISHSHKFIFIKSYKTAGTSVEAALSEICTDDDVVTSLGDYHFNRNEKGEWIHKSRNPGDFHQHDDAITIKSKIPEQIWNDYYKFSIVRNPWDRAVSFFFWENRKAPELLTRKRFYHYLGVPYDELNLTRKRFLEYIRGDWSNNDKYYSIDGKQCVDFVIRYEYLEEDFNKVCDAIRISLKNLPRLKTGMRQKNFHYSYYYDTEARRIVEDRNQFDINHFNYQFEMPDFI